MIKKPFLGLKKQSFKYDSLSQEKVDLKKIPTPETVTFLIEAQKGKIGSPALKSGEPVKMGQKIAFGQTGTTYAVSSVAGSVTRIYSHSGDFGQNYIAVDVKTVPDGGNEDYSFLTASEGLSIEKAVQFFGYLPGKPEFKVFLDSERPINTIVVIGSDQDLFMTTNQYVVQYETEALNMGISVLKKITGVDHIVIALPQYLMKKAGGIGGATGVEIRVIDSAYPSANPFFIAKNVLGKIVPAGKCWEDIGISFFKAEAVASIGKAVLSGKLPMRKTITVVKKDKTKVLVDALIGTPIEEILRACEISLNDRDRVIIGGPMSGKAIFSENWPVLPDTDAVMIQDAEEVFPVSDYPCINCGDCVRICPTRVPVNMLVRFCEAGQYKDAAEQYDLFSCIECGLCSFVCVSGMPVFQYIRLAKFELNRIKEAELAAEESHE